MDRLHLMTVFAAVAEEESFAAGARRLAVTAPVMFGRLFVMPGIVEYLLESGELRAVLVDYETPPVPIHVVHREGRYASARLRSFVDLMVARLRAEKTLQ